MNDPLKNDRPAQIYFGPFAFLHFFNAASKRDPNFAKNYVRNIIIFVAVMFGGAFLFVGCISAMVFGGFFAMFTTLKTGQAQREAQRKAQQAQVEQQQQAAAQQQPAEAWNENDVAERMNQLQQEQKNERVAELAKLRTEETELREQLQQLNNALTADDFPVTIGETEYADRSSIRSAISRIERQQKAVQMRIEFTQRRLNRS